MIIKAGESNFFTFHSSLFTSFCTFAPNFKKHNKKYGKRIKRINKTSR